MDGASQHGAEAELEGVVAPAQSGGVIRYRVWPAKRHPARAVAALSFCVILSVVAFINSGLFWALFVALGTGLSVGLFFLPTEVSLDRHTLNVRALGVPRTWDLRHFRRFVLSGPPMAKVELIKRSGFDLLENMSFPVPKGNEAILEHLRRWVGRTPTGSFEIDDDLVPEDAR